jgi:hypothetical protein
MSNRELLFQWASTIKIKYVGLVLIKETSSRRNLTYTLHAITKNNNFCNKILKIPKGMFCS